MQDKDQVTNLDQDLKSSRFDKYNKLQNEIKQWFDMIFQTNQFSKNDTDLIEYLKDGVILCDLINQVYGSNTIKYKQSKLAFVQMENIEFFLNFIKSKGVPESELFQTVDLYESKDPYQVTQTIQSFSRIINKIDPTKYPLIGPVISTKRERPKIPSKPKHLENGMWSTTEYGYMGGSNQNTERVVFGGRRDITGRK
ncbi:hypothetical protein CANARDRAFT_203910 [[Candida] arabinofermentans NRRL YB-2248]|uniref:Calponin-homology (CH) domain-containing protein n=1 Tax=[Candida] arabinofermentans NRRL YB-2248 TaxID=983967 RepID=A0A1E4SUA1_9ASCO|nr:hypothetical protein CANARDRAFT_203910 [[Candida] arabinofermentans NRRL YB-2248]